MANYFYVKRVSTTNQVVSSYTGSVTNEIANGDYFLLTAQTTASENGIYLRNNGVNAKISTQPTLNVDLVLSLLDNQEWKLTGTNTYTKSPTLGAAAGIRLAIIDAMQGATKPLPVGASQFPETIDLLKVLDYSSDSNANAGLVNYYNAMAAYFTSPTESNANAMRVAAASVQQYILTEEDYNKLASSIMNIQLYLKQYLPGMLASYQQIVQSFVDNSNSYYFGEVASYAVYVSSLTPPTKTIGGNSKRYIWFKEV